jgi:ActR/RegA family two-component response regulator
MDATMLLLVESDELVRRFSTIFSEVGVVVQVVPDTATAISDISTKQYCSLLVDCSIEGGIDVLELVRQAKTNQKAIVFAIVRDQLEARKANLCGANFLITTPVNWDLVRRMARASQSMLLRERRSNDRERVRTTAFLSFTAHEEVPVMTLDLSDGGMAVLSKDKLTMGAQAFVRFLLPGTSTRVECKGKVMWTRNDGQAGLKFLHLSDSSREDIKEWFKKHRPKRMTRPNQASAHGL